MGACVLGHFCGDTYSCVGRALCWSVCRVGHGRLSSDFRGGILLGHFEAHIFHLHGYDNSLCRGQDGIRYLSDQVITLNCASLKFHRIKNCHRMCQDEIGTGKKTRGDASERASAPTIDGILVRSPPRASTRARQALFGAESAL